MRSIFDDAGLRYLEVEFLADFFVDPCERARQESDRVRKQLFETAAAFDAHHIKVGNIPGTPCELGRLTEEFAALCDDAALAHRRQDRLRVHAVRRQRQHARRRARAGRRAPARPNGGAGHRHLAHGQAGDRAGELRRIPAQYLGWVELSDGQFENMEDRVDETVNHRRLPGEGEFDIPGYVAACRQAGYPGPWGVEVLSAALRSLPIEQEFERAYETTAAQFGAAVA